MVGRSETAAARGRPWPGQGRPRLGRRGRLVCFAPGRVGIGAQHSPHRKSTSALSQRETTDRPGRRAPQHQTHRGRNQEEETAAKRRSWGHSKKCLPGKARSRGSPPVLVGAVSFPPYRPWSGWRCGPTFPRGDKYYSPNPTPNHRPPRLEGAPTPNPPATKPGKRNRREKTAEKKPVKKANPEKRGLGGRPETAAARADAGVSRFVGAPPRVGWRGRFVVVPPLVGLGPDIPGPACRRRFAAPTLPPAHSPIDSPRSQRRCLIRRTAR